MAPYGVDFVDENDAGGILFALFKEIAHAARAHADEHLDKIRTGDREKRNVGFASNRAGQQRFASSRRADEQYSLGNATAQLLELLRLAQEFDDLLEFFLGFLDSCHVLKRDFLLL